jgi:hypothetical protein
LALPYALQLSIWASLITPPSRPAESGVALLMSWLGIASTGIAKHRAAAASRHILVLVIAYTPHFENDNVRKRVKI